MPLTVGLIAGGAGLVKSLTFDKAKENRERALAAETQRFSPWTKLQAGPIQTADPFAATLSAGATGAQLGQGIQNANAQNDLLNAQSSWLNSGGNPGQAAMINAAGSPATNPAAGMSPYGQLSGYNYGVNAGAGYNNIFGQA